MINMIYFMIRHIKDCKMRKKLMSITSYVLKRGNGSASLLSQQINSGSIYTEVSKKFHA